MGARSHPPGIIRSRQAFMSTQSNPLCLDTHPENAP